MITHADEEPEFEPDDPLAVLLRPTSDHLGPPPGRFATIRRRAARRRLVRTAVGAGVTCAVALLVALPLRNAVTSDRPVTPTVPLAPPPVTTTPSPTTGPTVLPRPAESPFDDHPGASAPRSRASEPRARGLVVPTPGPMVSEAAAPENRRRH
ncbi:hypothetical protein [Streptomyces sp. OP7]|uniref:hypothetical protein n=1 Tax=Streptomyces sp. OP7 TaxID=3142462 RepID=UPI0032E8560A